MINRTYNGAPIKYWKCKQYFFGPLVKDINTVAIFSCNFTPLESTHGNIFSFCTGGFKTRKEAHRQARWVYDINTTKFIDVK